jgi:alpha-beta hydrolase superfamily lysophospholipase
MSEMMPLAKQWELDGKCGRIAVREWPNLQPRYVAVLSHGAAEHIGRYDHVAEALVRHGASVFGPDHLGHGRSAGVRMLIRDFEDVVTDLHSVAGRAIAQHPGIPLVLIGHSMGGMIAARYAQRYGGELAALVLSGPVIGPWPLPGMLLAMDPFPEIPIDPAVLSRDLEVGRAYAADPLVWHGALTRESLEATVRCLAAIDEGPSLGALPTLWLHGGEDALVPVEVVRQGLAKFGGPALTSRVHEGARHEVFNETNKAEVLGDVMSFIDSALAKK